MHHFGEHYNTFYFVKYQKRVFNKNIELMKKVIFGLLIMLTCPAMAQWYNRTISHNTLEREYRLYIPENFQPSQSTSLIMALHGMSDTSVAFSKTINIERLANQEQIIVVCPQALHDTILGHAAWNSGAGIGPGKQFNESVDDVDFIRTLIVKVSEQYAIAPDKVFAFGFSMGGFMVQRLALELNDKITVFASVAGTIGESLLPILETISVRPVSIAHFHGTRDSVVAYGNNAYGNNVSMMLAFWKKNNKSKPEAEHHFFPDRINDGFTVDHYRYTSEFNNAIIELFKINGGFHRWLNDENNSDISYTDEIWKFFKQNHIRLSKKTFADPDTEFVVYPNPIDGNEFTIKLSANVPSPDTAFVVSVYDNLGRTILQKECVFLLGESRIITTVLKKGIYLMEIKNKENFKRSFTKIVAN